MTLEKFLEKIKAAGAGKQAEMFIFWRGELDSIEVVVANQSAITVTTKESDRKYK